MHPDQLLLGISPDGAVSLAPPAGRIALLPGSFNPLHAGHRTLAAVVETKFGLPVHFELSRTNVDKPELPREVCAERASQFLGYAPVWLTRAHLFHQKANLFPGALFVVGFDTAARLLDARYYPDDAARDRSVHAIADLGCRFVVGGRLDSSGAFRTWGEGTHLPPIFDALTEEDFRIDLSSTELRAKAC